MSVVLSSILMRVGQISLKRLSAPHCFLHLPIYVRSSPASTRHFELYRGRPWLGSGLRPFHRNIGNTTAGWIDPTIFALSSAPGRAAIAVIRISGAACAEIYQALCPGHPFPKARYAAVRSLSDPVARVRGEQLLDSSALVLFFPGPRSSTGEDVLEFHVHGGRAVVEAVLAAISRIKSSNKIRYAEPGEFTRRAFLNNRLDLTQVEALGDTLTAVTEQQRRLAVRGTTSKLSKQYEAWRLQLLQARGEIEALIDFSEDQQFEETPVALISSVSERVDNIITQIRAHSNNAMRGELLRNGINISLLGAPNAGKSSLLNRIVGREAAIVSSEEGTTRDVIDVGIDVGGFYCKLGDMAGLRHGSVSQKLHNDKNKPNEHIIGLAEQEGIRRAKKRALESDVVIVVLSLEDTLGDGKIELHISPEVMATAATCSKESGNVVVVVNKVDKLPGDASNFTSAWIEQIMEFIPNITHDKIYGLSCKLVEEGGATSNDAGGIQALLNGLADLFKTLTSPVIREINGQGESVRQIGDLNWEDSLVATKRQRLLLDECALQLENFLSQVDHPITDENAGADSVGVVEAAESLRAAGQCLAKITGKGEAGDVEEVLGVVFEKFCVGK